MFVNAIHEHVVAVSVVAVIVVVVAADVVVVLRCISYTFQLFSRVCVCCIRNTSNNIRNTNISSNISTIIIIRIMRWRTST